MKTDDAYTKIMNQLDVLHREVLTMINLFLISQGVDDTERNTYLGTLMKKWEDERKRY